MIYNNFKKVIKGGQQKISNDDIEVDFWTHVMAQQVMTPATNLMTGVGVPSPLGRDLTPAGFPSTLLHMLQYSLAFSK